MRANDANIIANGELRLLRCANPLIEEVYGQRSIWLSDGTSAPMNVYIPREQGDYLYSLVRDVRPALSVEVGMANGLSTFFIAEGLRENGHGRHVAIDPFQSTDWRGAGVALLRKAGLESLVELRESFSHQALPQLELEGARAQFVFIDGAHLFDYVIADFLCCDRILDVGGLIAFDDSDWPAVSQAIRFVLANRKYEVAFGEVVIEPPRITPTLFGRVLRSTGKAMPKLGSKLRADFMKPNDELGVRGRCVVLRKLGNDDRDSQSRFHHAF
jgi:predicted O-methyltransferase YrrM